MNFAGGRERRRLAKTIFARLLRPREIKTKLQMSPGTSLALSI
jgi:hypothetical protein